MSSFSVKTVEHWPLQKLIPYARNARMHDEVQISHIAGSIAEFGFVNPILVGEDRVIIAGHGRLMAAQQLGLPEVPVMVLSHLSETQRRALVIADNKIAEQATWNEELLKLELADLQDIGFDLNLLGFSDEKLDELLACEEELAQSNEDLLPEVKQEVISQHQDVWFLGEHRLFCGDATQVQDLECLMVGELADMAFTDPPYNVDYGKHAKGINAKDNMRRQDRRILNDNLGKDFEAFLCSALANMLSVTRGACYVAMSSSELDTLQKAFRKAGGKWSTFIIWAKNNFTLGRSDYQRQYEAMLYGWREGHDHYWCGARDQGDVWFFNKPARNDLHPTMKPVELIERALCNSSKTQAVVLDLFAGSGSTLIACEKTRRKARLMELDPIYVDVMIRRWQQYSGGKAVRAADGLTFDELAG